MANSIIVFSELFASQGGTTRVPRKTYTLFLAKEPNPDPRSLLTESARERIGSQTTQALEGLEFSEGSALYIFDGVIDQPNWFRELSREFPSLSPVSTKSSSGVLVFRASGRTFVCTFAHGWMFLKNSKLEGDFGLRVAMNALDDEKLRRIERANLGDAIRGTAISPFSREFKSFGTDDVLDLIRKLGGRTKGDASPDSLSRARSLKVTGEFSLVDLPALAAESLSYFESEAYRNTDFKIFDVVAPVVDKDMIDLLDGLAVESIRSGQDDFEIGLPVDYDDDEAAFRFVGTRMRRTHPDLTMGNYRSEMGQKLGEIDQDTLRKHKVVAVFDDGVRPDQHFSIRMALVGSIPYRGGLYAINEGEWYRLDEAFKRSVDQFFEDIVSTWVSRPLPFRKEYYPQGNGRLQSEESYNQEAARHLGYVCLDQQLIQIDGVERSSFELCDLLDIDGKRLIHIKKGSRRSNILSHFIKQGANSALNLKRFPSATDRILEKVRRIADNDAARKLEKKFANEDKWKIEFWIADVPRQNGTYAIPFFSRVTLREEVIRLQAMQYDVTVKTSA